MYPYHPVLSVFLCSLKVANYSCSCLTGFAGRHCQTNVDDCFTRPCRNSGVCQDGINTFTCQCAPGYYGQVCENVQPTTAAPWRPTTAHPTTPRPTTSVTTSPPTTSGPSASSSSEPSTATSQEATTKSQPTKSAVGNNGNLSVALMCNTIPLLVVLYSLLSVAFFGYFCCPLSIPDSFKTGSETHCRSNACHRARW